MEAGEAVSVFSRFFGFDALGARVLRLTLLVPEIVHAILAWTLRKSIPMDKLSKTMPERWADQKKLFGFECSQRLAAGEILPPFCVFRDPVARIRDRSGSRVGDRDNAGMMGLAGKSGVFCNNPLDFTVIWRQCITRRPQRPCRTASESRRRPGNVGVFAFREILLESPVTMEIFL